jgi:hypothetical protein
MDSGKLAEVGGIYAERTADGKTEFRETDPEEFLERSGIELAVAYGNGKVEVELNDNYVYCEMFLALNDRREALLKYPRMLPFEPERLTAKTGQHVVICNIENLDNVRILVYPRPGTPEGRVKD